MWEVSNHNQIVSFLISFAFGALYCLVYDVLRSIRKVGRNDTLTVAIQDVVFFVVIAFVTFMIMLAYTCGEIRFYVIGAILLGAVVCNYTISPLFRRCFVFVLRRFIRIFSVVKRAIKGVKFKISHRFAPIKEFLLNIFKKIPKTLKNYLKQRRSVVYTKSDH